MVVSLNKFVVVQKSLLHRLREGRPTVLVQDWFKDVQSRGRVRSAVESVLDRELPESYDRVTGSLVVRARAPSSPSRRP